MPFLFDAAVEDEDEDEDNNVEDEDEDNNVEDEDEDNNVEEESDEANRGFRVLEPFCACGRVISECDRSRAGCQPNSRR